MAPTSFDPLTATAVELQNLLETGVLDSVQIVERYLQQIDKYDRAGPCLNALISVAPRHILLSSAMALDEERAAGHTRGPFHGIPIILKVVILVRRIISSDLHRTLSQLDLSWVWLLQEDPGHLLEPKRK
jgi:amidase